MLSIHQCKKHIKKCGFTEQQIEEIRSNLYQLANVFVDEYLQSKDKNFSLTIKKER